LRASTAGRTSCALRIDQVDPDSDCCPRVPAAGVLNVNLDAAEAIDQTHLDDRDKDDVVIG
jgi:hypothetical protein